MIAGTKYSLTEWWWNQVGNSNQSYILRTEEIILKVNIINNYFVDYCTVLTQASKVINDNSNRKNYAPNIIVWMITESIGITVPLLLCDQDRD